MRLHTRVDTDYGPAFFCGHRDAATRQYTDNEKAVDEALSIQLLGGFDVNSGKNIDLNSGQEQAARAALARLVRDKLHGFAGELLALAIDPVTPSPWGSDQMRPACRIKFTSLPGGGSSLLRDKYVVDFIRRKFSSDTKLDALIAEAEKHFGLKRSRIHKIWSDHEKMLKRAASTE